MTIYSSSEVDKIVNTPKEIDRGVSREIEEYEKALITNANSYMKSEDAITILENERNLLSIFSKHLELVNEFMLKADYFSFDFHKNVFSFIQKEIENGVKSDELVKFYFDFAEQFGDSKASMFMCCIYDHFIHDDKSICRNYGKFYAERLLENYKKRRMHELMERYSLNRITREEYMKECNNVDSLTVVEEDIQKTVTEMREEIIDDSPNLTFTRFEALSNTLNLQKTDIITVGAPTGLGKSAFMINLVEDMAFHQKDVNVQYFNLEINEKTVQKRLLAVNLNRNIEDIKSLLECEDPKAMSVLQLLSENVFHLWTGSKTIEALKSSALSHKDDGKVNVIVVDHIGLLETEDRDQNKTEYSRTTYVMKQLRGLALDYGFIIFVVSQLDRASMKDKNVSNNSFKGSGEIENSSTHTLILSESTLDKSLENKEKGITKDSYQDSLKFYFNIKRIAVKVSKNRSGRTGEFQYEFNLSKQRFEELGSRSKGNKRDEELIENLSEML